MIQASRILKEEIRARYTAGESVYSLSQQLGTNAEFILNNLCHKLTVEDEKNICKLYLAGSTCKEISNQYGFVSPCPTIRILEKNNIKRRSRGCGVKSNHIFLTEGNKLDIAERYRRGESINLIRKVYGIHSTTIFKIVECNKIKIRTKEESYRTKYADESIFSDPLTEEARYWIGFIMGDGSIVEVKNGSPIIQLGLAGKDRDHVHKFKSFLKSTHTVQERIRYRNGRSFENCSISISSKKLADRLSDFGITTRKSFTAKLHKLENDPHAWRGLVDADGTVGIYRGYPRIQIVGSKDVCNQFLAFADSICPNGASVREHGKIFKVVIAGNPAKNIVKKLYENCQIALDRKLVKALEIMNWNSKTPARGRRKVQSLINDAGTLPIAGDIVNIAYNDCVPAV